MDSRFRRPLQNSHGASHNAVFTPIPGSSPGQALTFPRQGGRDLRRGLGSYSKVSFRGNDGWGRGWYPRIGHALNWDSLGTFQPLDKAAARCDYVAMRTTLTIDDDVLAVARALSERTGTSLGCALSELARRGVRSLSATERNGDGTVFAIPADAEPITSEDVYKALDGWP